MKTALLFGATGLVGGHVLNQLIQNNNYSKIKIFVRSSTQINNSKIEVIQTDFNNLEKYKAIIPCGISNRGVTNLKKISEQNYEKIQDILIEKFLTNLKSLNA